MNGELDGPAECLALEESLVGIEAAIAAGMKALLYDLKNLHTELCGVKKIKHFSEVLEHC